MEWDEFEQQALPVKTTAVEPPSVFPQVEGEPSPIALKAYFTGCAQQGHIATALRGFGPGLILTLLARWVYTMGCFFA